MQANEEDVFNHEIAKRCVARAALHLGIDSMSQEALDVMGDVLLSYLERVGNVLSQMVESSGRTSAHTNVLDAVRAIDVCTSPAVHQLHVEGETGAAAPTGVGWKDLASFLLGPDWMQQKEQVTQPEAGGKVGPSSVEKKTEKGWEAPYLDEIPHYPQASKACANPHSLDRAAALSLHGSMPSPRHDSQVLNDMPDDAFTTEWGAVKQSRTSKRKKKASKDDHEDAPPTKRAKLQDGKGAAVEEAKENSEQEAADGDKKPRANERPQQRPAYVPSFLPPFPSSGPGRSIAVGHDTVVPQVSSTAQATAAARKKPSSAKAPRDVRSSLVKMGEQTYWGSGWDADASPTKVPVGRRPPKTEKEAGKKEEAHEDSKVRPLDKPSVVRTSRIIEGSMDAS